MNDWLTYIAFRIGGGILGVLPEVAIRTLGTFGGWLSWTWAKGRKDMAIRHMRRVLGPDADHEKAARGMFSAYGRYWAETFWFRPRRAEAVAAHITAEGVEHIRAAHESGRGVVVALPHLGNWEMAATIAEDVGVKVTAVAEALANRKVLDWFLEFRSSLDIDVLIADNGGATMRALLTALKNGQLVALVSDRDIPGTGVAVEFFGEETTLPGGPAALALRTNSVLLPVASYFKEGRGHSVRILPSIEPPEEGTRDAKVADMISRMAAAFEDLIRENPTQWHLVQPNWPSDRAFLAEREQ